MVTQDMPQRILFDNFTSFFAKNVTINYITLRRIFLFLRRCNAFKSPSFHLKRLKGKKLEK